MIYEGKASNYEMALRQAKNLKRRLIVRKSLQLVGAFLLSHITG